jgi:membrane carboxypeptidase/penicillin-binding protein
MVYSFKITDRYPKSQILSWYLNEISYGGVYNGIEAASQGYFGKPASELTLAEAALLVGIPQAPVAYDPYSQPEAAVARRNQVLELMSNYVSIQVGEDARYPVDLAAIEEAMQAPLVLKTAEQVPVQAPHCPSSRRASVRQPSLKMAS